MPFRGAEHITSGYGEIRPNHFHSGIDYALPVGRELLAVDRGWVSRIRVSSRGYGKVVYIDHPQGLTSVYAHCSKFSPEMEAYVRQIQNDSREYELDVLPDSTLFPVVKGQIVAYSGNHSSNLGASSAKKSAFAIPQKSKPKRLAVDLIHWACRSAAVISSRK